MGEMSDKFKGKAKQVEGQLTGNNLRKAEGQFDQAKGNMKGAAKTAADKVEDLAHQAKDKLRDIAHKTADKVEDMAHKVKDSVRH